MSDAAVPFEKERGIWLDQVAADGDMSAAGLRAALVLSHYMNRDERCAWASMDRMAQDFGLARETILAGLRALDRRGHINVQRGRGRATSTYRWRLNGVVISSGEARWTSRSGDRNDTTSSPRSGARDRTTTEPRSGDRLKPIVVHDFDRSGAESLSQTSDEPQIEPPSAPAALRARQSAPRRARLRSSNQSRSPKHVERDVRPSAGLRPARAQAASEGDVDDIVDEIERWWCWSESCDEIEAIVRKVLPQSSAPEIIRAVRESKDQNSVEEILQPLLVRRAAS